MTIERIRQVHEQRPFRPFTIRTAGREYRVASPEFMLVTPSGRTIVLSHSEDSLEIIDLLLVESIHFGRTRPRRTNGRRAS